MSVFDSHKAAPLGEEDPGDLARNARFGGVLRRSHIFSSVVREILETRVLEEASDLPLTLSQFHMLKLMTVTGRHQVGELSTFLGVSAPAVTKNVDKLERFGLVLRVPSEDDRRATWLVPSQKGRRLVERYEALKAKRLFPVLDAIPAEDLDRFADILEKVSVALLRQEETPRGFCLRCAAYIETGCPVGHVRGGCPYDPPGAGTQALAVEE
jgi:DNA-binding MarR family transcriptional regulator